MSSRRPPWTMQLIASALTYGAMLFFVGIPLVVFLLFSFFVMDGVHIRQSLSLTNYVRIVTDQTFLRVLWKTCVLGAQVACLTLLLAYPVAYWIAQLREPRKRMMTMLFVLPLLISYIVRIYSIRSLLGGRGLLSLAFLELGIIHEPLGFLAFNLNSILITQTVLFIPFALLPILLALERIPRNLYEASFDLGASRVQTLIRVVVPLSLPGVVTAVSFVFVLAVGDFLTPQMVGGQSGFTYGRVIYSQFGTAFNWPFGAALSVILMLLVLIVIGIGSRIGKRARQV